MSLKPIVQLYPVLPTKDEAERERLRPLGRNRKLYSEVLNGWHDIIRACDNNGFWGVATIEHHFWSEGYEVGPSPGTLDAYWAAITKNVRVGQLGYVMSTQNPIRVAEETAIIDHLSGGRSFVGFARGYQSRWTNVVGQHLGARATRSPNAAIYNPATTGVGFSTATKEQVHLDDDARNRANFEEGIDIVIKSWTQESFKHSGLNWKIPYPEGKGVDDWQLAHQGVTQRFGAPREVGADNSIQEISVCPAPLQDPHPPVFVSGSGSPETIEYCAKRGFIPVYFTNIGTAAPLSERYHDLAKSAGYNWKRGQNQCLVRWLQIGKTEEAARERVLKWDGDIFRNFYAAMGRRKMDMSDVYGSMMSSGLYVVGTVDSVRKQLMEQWKVFPAEFMAQIYHYAQMPKEDVIETMDIFMKHIKPDLDEIIYQEQRKSANAA